MKKNKPWQGAQKSEKAFWEWINQSFSKTTFTEDVKVYFADILELTELQFKDVDTFLDVGCGPLPVYLAMDKGKRTAVDPLMDFYQENFPYLSELEGVELLAGKIEDWEGKEKFHNIFMFNCLNHCEDLERTVGTLKRLLRPNGYLILTQHCHTQKWTRNFFRKTGFIFDRCHPHQFVKENVTELFQGDCKLIKEANIDHLDMKRIKATHKSITKKSFLQRVLGFFDQPDRLSLYVNAMVAFYYKSKLAGKPPISNYLFVFQKAAD